MGKLLDLPLTQIEENPKALRKSVQKDGIEYIQVRDGISSVGLLNPISVREYEKEGGGVGYRLVDGLHRLTAFGELGHATIPVHVVTVDDEDLLMTQIIANNNVKTTKLQFANAIRQMIQYKGFTNKEVAAKLKWTEKRVADTLGLLDLPDNVKKLVDEGTLNLNNAIALKKLPKDKIDDYLQAALTEDAATFGPKIESAAKELKSAALTGQRKQATFEPTVRVRKTTALKNALAEYERNGVIADIQTVLDVSNAQSPAEGAIAALKWVMSLDPVSLDAEKAKWEKERAELKEKAEAREQEKQRKKEEAAKKDIANAVAA